MSNGDGIQFTIKEMLAQIDGKITMLGQKLDTKADRSAVHEVKAELAALALVAVRQDGPIAGEVRDNTRRVGELERELDRRAALIDRVNEKADLSYVNGLKEDVHELGTQVGSLRKALYQVALSFAGGSLLFSVTLFAIFR